MKPFFKTIKGRIIISTLLFSFILSFFIAVASYRVYHNYLRQNLIRSSELSLQVIADTINNHLRNIYSLAEWCQVNDTIGEFALYGSKTAKQKLKVYDYLGAHYNSNNSSEYIQRVLVASNMKEFVQIVTASHSSATDVFHVVSELEYFDAALNREQVGFDMGFVYDPFKPRSQINILPLVRPIFSPYSSNIAGWVFISISPNLFTDAISLYQRDSRDSVFLTLAGNTYIYENNQFKPVDYNEKFFTKNENSSPMYSDTIIYIEPEQNLFFVTRPLNTEGCFITKEINDQELVHQKNFFVVIMMVICLIILLMGFFMSLLLNRMVNKPVIKIQERMEKIASGDFSKDASIEWENELGDIGRGINQLSESIQALMHSRLEMEKQKRDYEYQILQNQINPHFLYNTLITIKWMATIQNAPGIAEMTTSLSRLLKNISKETRQFVPLSEELNLLKDYFTIMKYRYGGTIKIDIKTDDDALLNCSILRFTLQPIVENSIFHGIEPKGAAGNIMIHIFRNSDQNLQIDITDDGVGMDQEMASSLLSQKTGSKTSFFKKIGISNVHNRIQLEFGDEYGLSIQSKPGRYTTVSILLPDKPCTVAG
jgi:two-component system sensor histidine kinase YesM